MCPEKTQQNQKYFSGFYNLFWFWGFGKLWNWSNRWPKKLKTTFQMRLGELRRLQTRQKGGSGFPRPRLTSAGPLLAALGMQLSKFGRSVVSKQTQAGDCVLSQNIAKPMLFLGFGSFFGSGGSETREIAATDGWKSWRHVPNKARRAEKAPD